MEVDSNLPDDKSPDVSDEMRLDASTRLRTLAPLHDDIAANEVSEEIVVSQDILQGPIANVSNDSESTISYGDKGEQAVPPKKTNLTMMLTVVIIVIVAGAAAIFIIIR